MPEASYLERFVTIDSVRVPTFLYGTAWKEDDTERLAGEAMAAGFAGIDTANQRRHYHEAGVGKAVAQALSGGDRTREQVFLQTKFTHIAGQDQRLPYDADANLATQVMQSFESSLDHLGVSHLDSYVLHGPSSQMTFPEEDWEVWRAMETIHESGRAKLLGVSNVNLRQLEALNAGTKVKLSFVQNRCFARNRWDVHIREFCAANSITYQGFSLLTANAQELHVPLMKDLVEKHQRSVPEIVFRFSQQVGMIPLTGTTDPAHMKQDLTCYDFELSPEDVALMENIAV